MIETICDYEELVESEPANYGVTQATMRYTIGPFKVGKTYESLWLHAQEGGWRLQSYDDEGKVTQSVAVKLVVAEEKQLEELEAILNANEESQIKFLPDGEITTN